MFLAGSERVRTHSNLTDTSSGPSGFLRAGQGVGSSREFLACLVLSPVLRLRSYGVIVVFVLCRWAVR